MIRAAVLASLVLAGTATADRNRVSTRDERGHSIYVPATGEAGSAARGRAALLRASGKRVYLTRHSNGGFFAHRLACELAPKIAAFVSIGGADFADASRCRAPAPMAALEIHGDADDVVAYDGGTLGRGLPQAARYPSARQSSERWARIDGCNAA